MLNPMTANPQCLNHGCQLAAALAAVGAAEMMQRKAEIMLEQSRFEGAGIALWCDIGGHAFSDRDPGRQRMAVETIDDKGEACTEYRRACGSCAASAGLTKPRVTRPKELADGAEDRA